MLTLADTEVRYGVVHDEHLDRDATIPVVSHLGAQGDVLVIRRKAAPAKSVIPAEGVAVVRGENGGNTHLLVGDGWFDSNTVSSRNLTLGTVTVPEDGTTLLSHLEHGDILLASGTYELRRQREQMDGVRLIAD